jgi:hypothetical protein
VAAKALRELDGAVEAMIEQDPSLSRSNAMDAAVSNGKPRKMAADLAMRRDEGVREKLTGTWYSLTIAI